jgi:hypothetical protein
MCIGSSRAAEPRLTMAVWLERELSRLEPWPEIFWERVYEFQYVCFNCDFDRIDAATTHTIRSTLRELIAEMAESIENYRFWLNLYDTFERNGVPLSFDRDTLVAELGEVERRSLAYDLARD